MPSPPVRTPRVLDLSTYAGLVIMGGLGVEGLTAWPRQLLAVGLCLTFGALYGWAARGPRSLPVMTAVFGAQTAIVTTTMVLHSSGYEAFAFLFVLMAVHVSTVFRPQVAAVWLFGFWVIHSAATFAFHDPEAWFVIVFDLTIYLVCGIFGNVLRQLVVSKDELGHTLRRLRRAQDHIRALAVAEERGRLARDLHDSVKQNLFAAGMQIGTARALLASDPRRAEISLSESDELIRQARSDLGLVIHELKPVELEEIGLAAALRDYITGWSRQSGVEARFEVEDDVGSAHAVPAEVGYALLRVAQEALANVSRHSDAESVDVVLRHDDPIQLTVRDDGAGFTPGTGDDGFGLRSMRERVESLGGRFSVSSTPGQGTQVNAQVGES